MSVFQKAEKSRQKLRLAITGISGSGKTFTALQIASSLGKNVALIDTEHGSASLYADKFNFFSVDLAKFDIEDYVDMLSAAGAEGFDVVVIDSLSHAWDALLNRVEQIAKQKYAGNSFRAWAEGTPLQNKLVEAILSYPGHIIATIRSKTEYVVELNEKGKTAPRKVGTAPVQRQGLEYEFSLVMDMSPEHIGFISKDRTGKFQDKYLNFKDKNPTGQEFGKQLADWLSCGAPNEKNSETWCRSKRDAVGRAVKSVFEGAPLFTPEEIQKAKATLDSFNEIPAAQRLPMIEKVLEDYEAEVFNRITAMKSAAALHHNSAQPQAPAQQPTINAPKTQEEYL